LYNTCYWHLVKSGVSAQDAQREVGQAKSEQKHELLFSRFGVNYNSLPPLHRKGSVILRVSVPAMTYETSELPQQHEAKQDEASGGRAPWCVVHEDIISDSFWHAHADILDTTSKTQRRKRERATAGQESPPDKRITKEAPGNSDNTQMTT